MKINWVCGRRLSVKYDVNVTHGTSLGITNSFGRFIAVIEKGIKVINAQGKYFYLSGTLNLKKFMCIKDIK